MDALPDASAWQKRLASKLDHTEISKEAYDILKDFQHSAKVVRIAGRVLLVAGAALDALELCNVIDGDLHDADQKIGKKLIVQLQVLAAVGQEVHSAPRAALLQVLQ